MGAKLKQVYKRDGATLVVAVMATTEAARGPFWESFGPVAGAIEEFMEQFEESPDSEEGDR